MMPVSVLRLLSFLMILFLSACSLDPIDQGSPYDARSRVKKPTHRTPLPPAKEEEVQSAKTYIPKGQIDQPEIYSEPAIDSMVEDTSVEVLPEIEEIGSVLTTEESEAAPVITNQNTRGLLNEVKATSSEKKTSSHYQSGHSGASYQSSGKGADTLIAMSDKQLRAGEFVQAAASAERAVRLNPHSPVAYFQLARVRFEQGKYVQSEQLARKSISYAESGGERRGNLMRDAWNLIAKSLSAQGNASGAEQARDKAASFE